MSGKQDHQNNEPLSPLDHSTDLMVQSQAEHSGSSTNEFLVQSQGECSEVSTSELLLEFETTLELWNLNWT